MAVSAAPNTSKAELRDKIGSTHACKKVLTLQNRSVLRTVKDSSINNIGYPKRSLTPYYADFNTGMKPRVLHPNEGPKPDSLIQLTSCKTQVTKSTLFENSPHSGSYSYKSLNGYLWTINAAEQNQVTKSKFI